MPFLPALPEDAAMLDVLQLVPETARPLVQFHEALMRGDSPLTVGVLDQRFLRGRFTVDMRRQTASKFHSSAIDGLR